MIDGKGRQPVFLDGADSECLDFDRLLNQAFDQNKNETLNLIRTMKKSGRPIKAAKWKEFFGQSCYRNCSEENEIILEMMELLEQRHYTQEAIDVISAEMKELLTMASMNGLELPEATLTKLRVFLQRLPEEKLAWMVSEQGYDGKKVMKLRSSWSGFGWRLFGLYLLSQFAADCWGWQFSNPFYAIPGLTAFIVFAVLFMGIFISLLFMVSNHTVKTGRYWHAFLHKEAQNLRGLWKKRHLRKEILCEKNRKAGWKKAVILLVLAVFFVWSSPSYDGLWVRLKDDPCSYTAGRMSESEAEYTLGPDFSYQKYCLLKENGRADVMNHLVYYQISDRNGGMVMICFPAGREYQFLRKLENIGGSGELYMTVTGSAGILTEHDSGQEIAFFWAYEMKISEVATDSGSYYDKETKKSIYLLAGTVMDSSSLAYQAFTGPSEEELTMAPMRGYKENVVSLVLGVLCGIAALLEVRKLLFPWGISERILIRKR